VSALSCFGYESEILLIPPASFIIANVIHERNGPNGTIKVFLETVDNDFQYLHKNIVC
jgi:hypothetical protein